MNVYISNKQKALNLTPSKKKIKQIVQFVLEQEKRSCDEVGIFFISDRTMRKMHADFFNDPTPTDCISFPIDESYLGDIFVCPETACRYAEEHDVDPYVETTLYLVHGLLHLLGYDDMDTHVRKIMRRAERRLMLGLKREGLLLNG